MSPKSVPDEDLEIDPEEMTHAERAFAFLDNPDLFSELQKEGESENRYFEHLSRNVAENTSFEEWVEFLDVFFDKASTDTRQDFEDDLARHAKNMVLGTGLRGSNFRVGSLAELVENMYAYSEAGLSIPNVDQMVEVTLEHTYDQQDNPIFVYGMCETLLSRVPNRDHSFSPSENTDESTIDEWSSLEKAVDLLARASVTARLQAGKYPSDTLSTLATEFVDRSFSPTIDGRLAPDCADAEAHLEKVRTLSYANENKAKRCAAALHARSNQSVLITYLYLTSQQVVEAYRHGQPLSRGQMLLAERQLDVVSGFNAPPTESEDKWPHYVTSYVALSTAIERTGGAFTSGRENRPDRADIEAAKAYATAAQSIRPVDPERAVKYWSKAFRSAATPQNDAATNIMMHETALAYFLRQKQTADERIRSVLDETITFHQFALARAKAYHAYVERDFDAFREYYHKAEDLLEQIPQSDINIASLNYRLDVIRAREYELDREFDKAIEAYKLVDGMNERLQNREQICEMKKAIDDDDIERAQELLASEFSDVRLFDAVVDVLSGKKPSQISTSNMPEVPLAAVDKASVKSLMWFLRLARVDPSPDEMYRAAVQERFYKL